MAQFNRFDICEAYSALEHDWNVGGTLQERVRPLPNSDQTYSKQVAGQLWRMKFRARPSLGGYDTLNDNAKEIYRQFIRNHPPMEMMAIGEDSVDESSPQLVKDLCEDDWRQSVQDQPPCDHAIGYIESEAERQAELRYWRQQQAEADKMNAQDKSVRDVDNKGERTYADELEALVDKHSMCNILTSLAMICDAKSEHVKANWQDKHLANQWDALGNRLERAAEKYPDL